MGAAIGGAVAGAAAASGGQLLAIANLPNLCMLRIPYKWNRSAKIPREYDSLPWRSRPPGQLTCRMENLIHTVMPQTMELRPGTCDLDFANVLALHQEVSLVRLTKSNERKSIKGILDRPMVLGEKISIHGQKRTPFMEGIKETKRMGRLLLQSRRSTYELFVPGNESLRLSLRYLRQGMLNYHEKIPDGFMDGGRTTKYIYDVESGQMKLISKREVMIVDARIDAQLQEFTGLIAEVFARQKIPADDVQERAILLSLLVNEYYGGQEESTIWRCDDAIRSYQKDHPSSPVPIGAIKPGHCRYRATMYKYQADRLSIPCRVVRGQYVFGGHAWNVVKMDGKDHLIDSMTCPDRMFPRHQTVGYHRSGASGEAGGIGGESVADGE